jgi:hypothetical protein
MRGSTFTFCLLFYFRRCKDLMLVRETPGQWKASSVIFKCIRVGFWRFVALVYYCHGDLLFDIARCLDDWRFQFSETMRRYKNLGIKKAVKLSCLSLFSSRHSVTSQKTWISCNISFSISDLKMYVCSVLSGSVCICSCLFLLVDSKWFSHLYFYRSVYCFGICCLKITL